MPATSKAQFRAMQAAAHGKSTLGISAKVGKDFVAATPSPKSLPARRGKESNDEFHNGPSRPGRNPPASPKATNQTPHAKQARHSLKKRPGIHARVKKGLLLAFPKDKGTVKASQEPASANANAAITKIDQTSY